MAEKLRPRLRMLLAGLLYYSGALSLWGFARRRILGRREVCILGLHRVLTEEQRVRTGSLPGIVMMETTFARLVDHLRRRFKILSLDDLLEGRGMQGDQSRPACLLTFDDGWKDNFTTAFPVLRKFKMPAVIFLVTGLIDSEECFWVERVNEAWKDSRKRQTIRDCVPAAAQSEKDAAGLVEVVEYLKHMSTEQRKHLLDTFLVKDDEPPHDVDRMMTWEQATEMSRQGIEFGGHAVNHPLLTFEDDNTVALELQLAKRTIETRLSVPVRSFAYPNGDWNDRVRRKVQEAGYECAFTTIRGWHRVGDDLFSIRRILLHEGNIANRQGEFSPAVFTMTLGRGW